MFLAVVQARMGSSRLPGKVMMNLQDRPVLWHVVNRLKHVRLINEVVVATSVSEADKKITVFCNANGVPCFAGSEEDVLERYYEAARHFGAGKGDAVVRITADCPLIDPEVVDRVVELYKYAGVDYASNVNPPTFPDGLDVEVFSLAALARAHREAGLQSEREHVTLYIRNHQEIFSEANLTNDTDLSGMRWTLDEYDDFLLISDIYRHLYREESLFLMKDILKYIEKNPGIVNLNSRFERNEGLKKSLENDEMAK